MNIEHFIVRARQFDHFEPNKTTARKLALELAAHINFLTTTDYGRARQIEHAEAALRLVVLLGFRLNLTDDDIELGLHSPCASETVLVQAGFNSVAAAFEAVTSEGFALRNWLHCVATLKSVLMIRNLDFNKSLTDFIIF